MMKILKSCTFVLFIVFVLLLLTTQSSFSSTLKFAQISDVHYSHAKEDSGSRLLTHTKELLDDVVNQINHQKNIKFVMLTGDGINVPDKSLMDDLITGLNKLRYPWYIVPGNHDTKHSVYMNKTNFLKEVRARNKNFKFTTTRYTFVPQKGFRVIVMDGAYNIGRSSHGKFSEEDLKWLDDLLAKSQDDVVLIFQHFPVVPPSKSKSHNVINADEYLAVIKKYKMPIGIFAGHYHRTKIIKQDNVLHVTSPAIISYPNAFRIVEVDNKQNKAIFKFEFYETNLKDLQDKVKKHPEADNKFRGTAKDRDVKITIEK